MFLKMSEMIDGFKQYNTFGEFITHLKREHDLTIQEVMILRCVYNHDEPVSNEVIYEETGLRPEHAKPYTSKLKKAKLIRKDRDDDDERYLVLLQRDDAKDEVSELLEKVELSYEAFMNPEENPSDESNESDEADDNDEADEEA